jgi:hypothetical protein
MLMLFKKQKINAAAHQIKIVFIESKKSKPLEWEAFHLYD